MPDDQALPSWAARLREERTRRLWSQKTMAVRLRDAADEATRAVLPEIGSIQRYVRDYEAGRHQPGDLYAELYCRTFGLTYEALFGNPRKEAPESTAAKALAPDEARSLISWIEITNVSNEAVEDLARVAHSLSEAHTQIAPALLLGDVIQAHRKIQAILRSGKQRLRQTRDLYRIDTDVLAHAALLLGDLHLDDTAAEFGKTSLLYAEEADSNRAIAFSVLAKTERWRRRFAQSADLARQGFECSPPTPIRVQLSSQEANAAALLGDMRRAREALRRAEEARNGPIEPDTGISAWSFPLPRHALFAMSVAIGSGDPDGALQAAQTADTAWASGDPQVIGTWAQVRLGASIAYIMKSDLDGALREFTPVRALDPELRMATITGYTEQMDWRLRQRRFDRNVLARDIREQIREFTNEALSTLTTGDLH